MVSSRHLKKKKKKHNNKQMIGQITNQDDVVEIVELIAEIDIAKLMSVINEDHIGFIRNQLTLESTKIVCNKIKNHCGGVITNDMKLFCPVALDDSKLLVWLDTISLEDVEDSVCTSSIYVSSIYSNSNPEIVLAVIKNMEIRSHQQFDRSFPLCLNIKTAQFKIVIKTFDLYMEFFERTKTRLDSRSLLKAIFTNRFPSLACEERRYMLDRIPVANTDDPANIFLQLMSEKKIKYLGENVVLYVLSSRKDNYYCSEILYHSSDICLVPVLKVLYSELTRSDFLAVLRIPKGSLRRTFLCRFVASTQTLEIPYSKISFLNDCFDIKDLSFTDERGETPLIIAIRSQSIQSFECVIFLLNQLPPEVRLRLMNRTDRSRLTSIHHVFLTNNVHALRRLVSFGVQIPSSEFVYNMFINSNKKFFSFFNVVVWFLLRENLPFKGPRKRAYCLKRYLTKQEEVSYDSFMKSLAMHCGGVRHK